MDSKVAPSNDSTCIRFLEEQLFDVKKEGNRRHHCERIKRILYGLLTIQMIVLLYYLPFMLEHGIWYLKLIALHGIIGTMYEFMIIRRELCFFIVMCSVASFEKYLVAFLFFVHFAYNGHASTGIFFKGIIDFIPNAATIVANDLMKNRVYADVSLGVYFFLIAVCIYMLIKAILYFGLFECICRRREETEEPEH